MIKFVTIIGARPQFIKAAAISRILRRDYSGRVEELLVHTGQHYDDNMSKVFFDQMEMPAPAFHLNAGSGSHGEMTGRMLMGLEKVLLQEKPDLAIVYGDTNTTLAGALAAAKLNIPVAHVEAGLRSFNRAMPEEINRVLTDHVSSMLFTPTSAGHRNLLREGFTDSVKNRPSPDNPAVFWCGDVMYDNALHFSDKAGAITVPEIAPLAGKGYFLCTIHRDFNTDDPARLNSLFSTLLSLIREFGMPVVLPLHPRTRKMLPVHLEKSLLDDLEKTGGFIMTGPLSYLEMLYAENHSSMILTDSGGVQKEAYFYRKPCLILRKETEWSEMLETGSALLVDADEERIARAVRHFMENTPASFPPVFGDGTAAETICREMVNGLT